MYNIIKRGHTVSGKTHIVSHMCNLMNNMYVNKCMSRYNKKMKKRRTEGINEEELNAGNRHDLRKIIYR